MPDLLDETFNGDFLNRDERDYGWVSEGQLIKLVKKLADTPSQKFHVKAAITKKYAVSVIRTSMSYGGREGLFEIALLNNKGSKLLYRDDFFNGDVGGYLTSKEIKEAIEKIHTF